MANLVAAFALQAGGQIESRARQTAGRSTTDAVALVLLHGALAGASQEAVAEVLGLTASGTVRLVNRLAREGLVVREQRDGRTVALRLTAAGTALAAEILRARMAAVQRLLAYLDEPDHQQLADLTARMLAGLTRDGVSANQICRMCDLSVCHDRDRCPVTEAAAEGEAPGGTR